MNNNLYVLKELEDKIDKTQVKNTLTETAEGSVLDARQGKVLNDKIDTKASKQELGTLSELTTTKKDSLVSALNEVKQSIPSTASINQSIDEKVSTHNQSNTSHQDIRNEIKVLSGDRGYIDTKIVPNDTDFNTITQNGNYWANAWVHKNIPTLQDGTRLNGVVNVYFADNVVYQFFHSNKGKWFREKNDTNWTEWQQLATTDQINALSNTKTEYIGKSFISEEILLDATYPIAYCGSVGNSSTMPNTGQFRVQYIPYFANNEGYSVQIAWGVVTNSGLWYRVASGTRWERWESFSTTTKTDISYTLNGGLTFRSENDSKGEYTETLASIRIMIDVNNADIFNWDFVWCTLPPQLRPRHQLSDILLDSGTGIVSINVLPNGNIIRGNLMPETKPTWIMGYVPMYGRSM